MTKLTLDKVNTIEYRMPLKRPYGTARGVTRESKNFLVRIVADAENGPVVGLGEAQPRHRLTGDTSIDAAWTFLQAAAETLPGRVLSVASSEAALDSVRAVMAELAVIAAERADERNVRKPFRGTLLGIEVALLDLVSRALGLPLSQVLGEQRRDVAITVSTLSTQNSSEGFRRKVERQARYPMVRVKGIGNFEKDSQLLALVHEANLSVNRVKPIWMDNNEGFDEPGALEFIAHIAGEIKAGRLPEIITLEQPIPGAIGDRLPALQRKADEETSARGVGEIRIMPDESLWDIDDLDVIHADGGCRAMNIKTAKTGGILASLDLARKAVEIKPETNICIGGMVGTSDITTWSLLSLAKALPRVDYITAVPPGNVKSRISQPLTAFRGPTSNVHLNSDQTGIGATLDEDAILPFIHRQKWFPEVSQLGNSVIDRANQVELRPASEGNMNAECTYRVLFLGDFHYGESYKTGGGTLLAERGYEDGTKYLKKFIDRADFTVANLEAPVVDPEVVESPFAGKKRFLHWADPTGTPAALKKLGVDAVSLANNHTLDFGQAGLFSSLEVLRGVGIRVFGAGKNLAYAKEPLRIDLPQDQGGGTVTVYGSMLGSRKATTGLGSYASESQPGYVPLSESFPSETGGTSDQFTFNVAFPHWGPNYKWRTPRQRSTARELLSNEVDLIIGHGAHCLQEFGRYRGKWVAYGIGNSHFQAQGRYDAFVAENGILPFSFWTVLIIQTGEDGSRWVFARFYPVCSDNKRTDFQPMPVTEDDFQLLVRTLYQRDARHFDSGRITGGSDDLGRFLQVEIKTANSVAANPRLDQRVPPLGSGSRGAASSPRPEPTSDERLLDLVKRGRTLGTQMIADRATEDGATVQWYGGATCILSWEGKRILLQGNRAVESSVGAGVIKDKYVTKTFLQKGGARAPEGYLATTADEAVEILKRMGRAIVIKPRAGDRGRAVTVNITDAEEALKAFARAEEDASGGVLVEEYIQGVEYRCIVTENECMSVVNRAQAHVIGDGESTVAQLIEAKNDVRRENPYLHKKPIPLDEDTTRHLRRQGLSLDEVPLQGAQVFVRPVGNFSQGADVVECSDVVGDDLKRTATDATKAIPGMNWAGVDVVISDESGLAYVLEVNSNSGIGSHHFPMQGEAKDIAGRIWQKRRAVAPSDANRRSSLPASRQTPGPLAAPGTRLSDVLRKTASGQLGYKVEDLGGGTYQFSNAATETQWVRGCSTTRDLSAVGSVLSRHGTVRRILEAQGIDVVPGKRLRGSKELHNAPEAIKAPFSLTGYLKPWAGAQRQVFASDGIVAITRRLSRSESVMVQESPEGVRLTVVASRNTVLLVLVTEAEQLLIEDSQLRQANELAIAAVRAVPELRWAAVDIVIENHIALVEGLSLNPKVASSTLCVAGSASQFAEFVMNGRI